MQLAWKIFLAFLIVGLTVGDIITTQIIISSGIGVEGNPVVGGIMDGLGAYWWVPKLLLSFVLAAMAVVMWYKVCPKPWERSIARFFIGVYVVFYVGLISYHVAILHIFKQLKTICG